MSTMYNEYNATMSTMLQWSKWVQCNNEYNEQWLKWIQCDNEYNEQW
jgi:hypothetical protein